MELDKSGVVPFSGSYWVEPGRFLAGCYPGAQRSDEAVRRLNSLLDVGIRVIINLMEAWEIGWKEYQFEPYEEAIQFLAQDRGFSVECLRMPVEDMEIPTYRAMKLILDTIDKAIEQGKSVYVHCWGGRGRTGTVVGCWLARHGRATGDEALALISELRRNDRTRFLPSPEAEVQRRMVRAWKIGQ